MLGSLILYFKGMRLMMFQLSSFYCREDRVPLSSKSQNCFGAQKPPNSPKPSTHNMNLKPLTLKKLRRPLGSSGFRFEGFRGLQGFGLLSGLGLPKERAQRLKDLKIYMSVWGCRAWGWLGYIGVSGGSVVSLELLSLRPREPDSRQTLPQ